MSITHTTRRLALVVASVATLALAGSAQAADPLAQERYYESFGTPATDVAHAQERAYMSAGPAESLTLPQSPTPDGTSWLPYILVAAGIGVTAGTVQLRRFRVRRGRSARALV